MYPLLIGIKEIAGTSASDKLKCYRFYLKRLSLLILRFSWFLFLLRSNYASGSSYFRDYLQEKIILG